MNAVPETTRLLSDQAYARIDRELTRPIRAAGQRILGRLIEPVVLRAHPPVSVQQDLQQHDGGRRRAGDGDAAAIELLGREHMQAELVNICAETGTTVLFVTHSIPEAVFLSDRVLIMTPRPGKVVAEVDIDLARPRQKEMIGTEAFGANVRRIRDVMAEHWSG